MSMIRHRIQTRVASPGPYSAEVHREVDLASRMRAHRIVVMPPSPIDRMPIAPPSLITTAALVLLYGANMDVLRFLRFGPGGVPDRSQSAAKSEAQTSAANDASQTLDMVPASGSLGAAASQRRGVQIANDYLPATPTLPNAPAANAETFWMQSGNGTARFALILAPNLRAGAGGVFSDGGALVGDD